MLARLKGLRHLWSSLLGRSKTESPSDYKRKMSSNSVCSHSLKTDYKEWLQPLLDKLPEQLPEEAYKDCADFSRHLIDIKRRAGGGEVTLMVPGVMYHVELETKLYIIPLPALLTICKLHGVKVDLRKDYLS